MYLRPSCSFSDPSLISVTANNCFLWLEQQGLAWVVTEASSMMKWGPMRVTVTSNVNFDSWLMNIKIVGAVHYLVIGPHCLNASECHFVGQKSLLIPSPASCPVHSSAPQCLACLPRLYWCTWWADGQAVRRHCGAAAGVPRDVTNEFSSTACRYKSAWWYKGLFPCFLAVLLYLFHRQDSQIWITYIMH